MYLVDTRLQKEALFVPFAVTFVDPISIVGSLTAKFLWKLTLQVEMPLKAVLCRGVRETVPDINTKKPAAHGQKLVIFTSSTEQNHIEVQSKVGSSASQTTTQFWCMWSFNCGAIIGLTPSS